MRRSKFSESQIVAILKEVEAGVAIADVVRKAGISKADAEAAMASSKYDSEIQSNIALAQKLQATGTPTFVIGDQVLSGAVGYDALKEGVATARGK